jgi:hypothetical protein
VTARNLAPVPAEVELPDGPFDVPIDANALPLPKTRVWPADGPPYDVQVYGSDMINYEETAVVHRWPMIKDAGVMLGYYLAWRASLREGRTDATWEVFKTTTRFVKDVSNPAADVAHPTPPGPVPG